MGINDISSDAIKVYPNPATNIINIDAGDIKGEYTLTIFNTLGQQITESAGTLNGQKLSSDVSDYAPGLYTLMLKTTSGILNSKFIVK